MWRQPNGFIYEEPKGHSFLYLDTKEVQQNLRASQVAMYTHLNKHTLKAECKVGQIKVSDGAAFSDNASIDI